MKKIYWVIIILLALALGAWALYYMRQPAPDTGPVTVHHEQPIATTTQTDLKDWKTYTNSQYGFSIMYPTLNTSVETNVDDRGIHFSYLNQKDKVYYGGFEFFIRKNASGLNLHDWFETNIDQNGILLQQGNLNLENIDGGGQAYDLTAFPVPSDWIQNNGPLDSAYIMSPDKSTVFFLDLSADYPSGLQNDLSQILSTFKFTNTSQSAVDTSGWKTYANTEFGFTLQYPQKFVVGEQPSAGDFHAIHFSNPEGRDVGFELDINNPGIGFEGYDVISDTKETVNNIQMQKTIYGDLQTKTPGLIVCEFIKGSDHYLLFANADILSVSEFGNIVSTFKFTK